MTAIEAASVRVRTLADGTLRAELDFEPRFAADAFKLLGAPGQPVAVAALKTAAAQREPAADKPKGGAWSQWLAVRCDEDAFRAWLLATYPDECRIATTFAEATRRICDVQSRAEIDNDPAAQARFQERIRGPWSKFWSAHAPAA